MFLTQDLGKMPRGRAGVLSRTGNSRAKRRIELQNRACGLPVLDKPGREAGFDKTEWQGWHMMCRIHDESDAGQNQTFRRTGRGLTGLPRRFPLTNLIGMSL